MDRIQYLSVNWTRISHYFACSLNILKIKWIAQDNTLNVRVNILGDGSVPKYKKKYSNFFKISEDSTPLNIHTSIKTYFKFTSKLIYVYDDCFRF